MSIIIVHYSIAHETKKQKPEKGKEKRLSQKRMRDCIHNVINIQLLQLVVSDARSCELSSFSSEQFSLYALQLPTPIPHHGPIHVAVSFSSQAILLICRKRIIPDHPIT